MKKCSLIILMFFGAVVYSGSMYVKNQNNILYIASKYNETYDLITTWRKCMANDLYTFYQIALYENQSDSINENVTRPHSILILRSTTDNIGPITFNGELVGGNHTYRDSLGVLHKTAKTVRTDIFNGDSLLTGNFSLYSDEINIVVENYLFNAADLPAENTYIIETVEYSVIPGTINIRLQHDIEEDLFISSYYGLQSAPSSVQDYIFIPNSQHPLKQPMQNDIFSGPISSYPDVTRVIHTNHDRSICQEMFIIPEEGLFSETNNYINNTNFWSRIWTRVSKTYFNQIRWSFKPMYKGDSYFWKGGYKWYDKSKIDSVHIHIPDRIYTTTASNFSIYYNNLIRGRFENKEQIIVSCEVGYPDSMRYNLDSLQAGIYDFKIQVYDSLGFFIEEAETEIIVTDNSVAHTDTLRVLIIGDSFTYAGVYPKYIKDAYESSTSYPIKLLGTNYNSGSSFYGLGNSIFHEGYSGRTWYWHANHTSSPFVYDFTGGIDIQRYISDSLNGEIPDIITIFLGINDIGDADPSTIKTIDERIDLFLNHPRMMKLINSLTQVLPETEIGIVLTPPTNEREETYTNPDRPDYWERKLMHHRLSQRYVDHFKNLGNHKISVIPSNVGIDTYNGFGSSDSIHPNDYGYNQIGHSIYSWIKYRISNWLTVPKGLVLNKGNDTMNLTWYHSTGADFYRIYRSTDPYSGFVEIGTSIVPEFTDEDISGSGKYFYRVTAVKNSN